MKKNKIIIVGNGQIGQAVFYLLKSNRNNKKYIIEIYDRDDAKNPSKKTLKKTVQNADFIFFCIPSWGEEKVLSEIAPIVKQKTIFISLSKGINKATQERTDQLIEQDIKNAKYALLYGPMFASEIKEAKMSFAILATKEKIIFKKVQELFSGTKLHLEYESDVSSVTISAILKNVYTLIFGMIDAFGEKNNTKGFLASYAIVEMKEIMKMLKLNEKIIEGTSGTADFIATVFCKHSQNRKLGIEIYKTGKAPFKSEGFVSLPYILKRLGTKRKSLPILSLLERIIVKHQKAQKEITKFFENI